MTATYILRKYTIANVCGDTAVESKYSEWAFQTSGTSELFHNCHRSIAYLKHKKNELMTIYYFFSNYFVAKCVSVSRSTSEQYHIAFFVDLGLVRG